MKDNKPPKFCATYDPATDPLKLPHVKRQASRGELILALKCASAANEGSGCKAWAIDSDFQKKIEELVGPRPYGDTPC